ncbi:MAG: zinc ribbon domain-containing protein [Steroidobacteraceae bacterium]
MPTKNTLRILVALQIAALLGSVVATSLSIPSLVRTYHLPTYVISSAPEVLWLANVLTLALLVVAVGLCFFADVFRTLYVTLTVALLLLYTLRPSVSSGSMDLLQGTDELLRGVIIAVVYFSPLSDLYKPRDRGDVRSAQRLLRYLILAQIPLLLVGFGAGLLTQLHNPDLAAISEQLDYGHPGRGPLAGTSLVAYLIVNVCLYLFWRGARTAYLIVTVVTTLEALYLSPSLTPAGLGLFTAGVTIMNGAILGLAYFSPLRAVFDRGVGTPAPAVSPVTSRQASSPAPAGPVGSAVLAGPVDSAATAAFARSVTAAVVPTAEVRFEPPAVVPPAAAAEAPPVTGPAAVGQPAFCGACGARSQGGKFCMQCGAPLPQRVTCSGCGTESEPGKKFCRECGRPLSG